MPESDAPDHGRGESARRRLPTELLAHACRVVELAWRDLPPSHRQLLEAIGASGREVVDAPLGSCVDDRMRSAGLDGYSREERSALDRALGVWIPDLRLIVVNAGHEQLAGLDHDSYEAALAHIAWHEWGHALSVVRADHDDVDAGPRLLDSAPPGVAISVRAAGYRAREYTHEIVAEVYALLLSRRRRGYGGRPAWLDGDIYDLVRRVTGWSE